MEAATLVSPYPQQKSLPPFPNPPAFLPQIHFFAFCFSLLLCAQTPTAEFPVPISAQCPKLLRGRPLSSPFFVFVLFLLGAHPGLLLFILRIRSLGHRTFLLGPKVNNLCFVFFFLFLPSTSCKTRIHLRARRFCTYEGHSTSLLGYFVWLLRPSLFPLLLRGRIITATTCLLVWAGSHVRSENPLTLFFYRLHR